MESSQEIDIDFWKVWNPRELERQFAPIVWIASHKDKKKTYDTHVHVSTMETTLARESIPSKSGVSYGTHENCKFDIYGTDLLPTAPTLFWVHGGYWRAGDRSWAAPAVRNAYSWGVRCIVTDYPLAPEVKLKEMCNAVCDSLSMGMKMFESSTFILGGHSAGAQLIISMFHEIPGVKALPGEFMKRVTGAFLLCGPYDMRPILSIPSINRALKMNSEETEEFSSILTMDKLHPGWISNKKLEILLGNGEYDPPALQKLGKIYADLLMKKRISVEFKVFNDDDHFSVLDNLSRVNSEIAKTFKSFLLRADERKKTAKL